MKLTRAEKIRRIFDEWRCVSEPNRECLCEILADMTHDGDLPPDIHCARMAGALDGIIAAHGLEDK